MTFKRWRLGLIIAVITGVITACTAAAVLDVQLNVKFVLFFIGLAGKDVVMFCKDHPETSVDFDNQTNPQPQPVTTNKQ